MKRLVPVLVGIIIIALFINSTPHAGAASPKIKVTVNNKTVKYEVAPYLKKAEAIISVKETAKAFGADVKWDKKNKTLWVNQGMMRIEFKVGKSEFYIHRDADFTGIPQIVKLNTPILNVRGSIMVPGKTVFENMGMKVTWDSKKNVLAITDNYVKPKEILYTEISQKDITKIKEVNDWYKNNYKKEGVRYKKYKGILYVLVGAGKKPTGGYTVEINKITYETTTKAFVDAYFMKPTPDMMVSEGITYPHKLIKLNGQHNITKVVGEVKDISLPDKVDYNVINYDQIKDNSNLTKWYNLNSHKLGIHFIREGKYVYVIIGGGERPSGGYQISIDEIYYTSNDVVAVYAKVTPPGDNENVTTAITYPSLLIRIKSDTIKSIIGEVIDSPISGKEKWATMDKDTVTKMELYTLDQVKIRDITGAEKEDIMKSYSEATIDPNHYIEMITGNVLRVETKEGYIITFTSYGSNTNVVGSFEKAGEKRSYHMIAPVIARTLLQ